MLRTLRTPRSIDSRACVKANLIAIHPIDRHVLKLCVDACVQEMGTGMNSAAVQQELAALETYCALMEENPAIELTERTKKLRQACFKENYKRRRAATVSMVDHIFNFDEHQYHHHQLHPLPSSSSSSAEHSHGSTSRFFGY
jgi:hypothetical protein